MFSKFGKNRRQVAKKCKTVKSSHFRIIVVFLLTYLESLLQYGHYTSSRVGEGLI